MFLLLLRCQSKQVCI